jgi:hypothetical protein
MCASQEQFAGIGEAVSELVEFFESEKTCTVEPGFGARRLARRVIQPTRNALGQLPHPVLLAAAHP